MWDVEMVIGLRDCPNCGENNWVKFEKPHGAPYFRCAECLEKYPANEIEYYVG